MNTIVWEYSDGNTISFNTDDLKVEIRKPYFSVDVRVDGTIVVVDPDIRQRVFTFSSTITGANANTLHDQVNGTSIDYSGAYPKIQTLTWVSGTTETNIEVAITSLSLSDLGNGQWGVNVTMVEKDQ
jgi:hypothetical protein